MAGDKSKFLLVTKHALCQGINNFEKLLIYYHHVHVTLNYSLVFLQKKKKKKTLALLLSCA